MVANIVAIPLTTFVIMPLEALALLLDLAGAGAPVWWLTRQALELLLWLANTTASAPGAVAALPAMPGEAFALMAAGGVWMALWRTRARWAGLVPLGVGAAWAMLTPAPDLLITGDGRHLALRMADGSMALLRDRAGDYTRQMLAENGGIDDALVALADQPGASCSPDLCVIEVRSAARHWDAQRLCRAVGPDGRAVPCRRYRRERPAAAARVRAALAQARSRRAGGDRGRGDHLCERARRDRGRGRRDAIPGLTRGG